MILRKHLEGGKIVSLHQSELERVVTFDDSKLQRPRRSSHPATSLGNHGKTQ